jgi:2-polyprenyl-3-methyl-5-hydroxy-6-metoxy-1,4-benzoquinol methylase
MSNTIDTETENLVALRKEAESLKPWRYNHSHNGFSITSDFPASAKVHDDFGRDSLIHVVKQVIGDRNPTTLRALDLGSLEGHYSDILCSFNFQEVVSVDLSSDHIKRSRFLLQTMKQHTNSTLVQGSVTDESLMSSLGKFDLVLFHGLLYHLKDPLVIFDVLEHVAPEDRNFHLLLSTQYKGRFSSVISPLSLADMQIKPLKKSVALAGSKKILVNENDGSAFDRCSFRLNPAAVYQVLQTYGYTQMIGYDTPDGASYSFNSNLIVNKIPVAGLVDSLNRTKKLTGVRFYDWDGLSVNGFSFKKSLVVRMLRAYITLSEKGFKAFKILLAGK